MSNLQQVENPRAQIARMLADYYSELSGTVAKPAPRFSLQRVFTEMSTDRGLHDGYEKEVCASAAIIAGGAHDPHRVRIPWAAFASRAAAPMTVASDATGGFLRGVQNLAAVDVLRPWSVVARAGITVVENLRGNITIPTETAAPTGQWLPTETTAVTLTQPTLAQTPMTPHTFGAVVSFSHLVLKQAPNIEAFLGNQVVRAASRAVDQGVFAGSGSDQPVGILGTANLPSESGTSFALANACNMLEALSNAIDDSKVTFIAAPNARKTLQQRVAVTGGHERFIWDDDRVLNRPAYATPDMTSAIMLAGDFSRAILGLWGVGFELTINPYEDFEKGIQAARVFVTCDVSVPQVAAFVKTTAIS